MSELEKMRLLVFGDKTTDTKDDLFNLFLEQAESIALNTLYPYIAEKPELPTNYSNWKVRCAKELYDRKDFASMKEYSENQLKIVFDSSNVSSELMNELVPFAGLPE